MNGYYVDQTPGPSNPLLENSGVYSHPYSASQYGVYSPPHSASQYGAPTPNQQIPYAHFALNQEIPPNYFGHMHSQQSYGSPPTPISTYDEHSAGEDESLTKQLKVLEL